MIITAAIGLIEPVVWRELADTDHVELAIAAITAAGVILTGVLEALVFAAVSYNHLTLATISPW